MGKAAVAYNSVIHRIGGLETEHAEEIEAQYVIHRIGGLENRSQIFLASPVVIHRIGGLESQTMPSSPL